MEKILPRITPLSPYEVYMQRVNATFDAIRKTNASFTYTPSQFGGLFGQIFVANNGVVLELTEFEVE